MRQGEWCVDVGEQDSNNENEQGECNDDDAQNLVWVSCITSVVSENRKPDIILRLSQIDKENNEYVWDEMLHQQAPDEWNRTNDILHAVAQAQNIAKVHLPQHRPSCPLSIRISHDLVNKVDGNSKEQEVNSKETDKTAPDGRIGRESVPQNAADDDSSEVGRHEGVNNRSSLAFDLSDNVVGPGTSKGFEETDQNHDKVDVKVYSVQEA